MFSTSAGSPDVILCFAILLYCWCCCCCCCCFCYIFRLVKNFCLEDNSQVKYLTEVFFSCSMYSKALKPQLCLYRSQYNTRTHITISKEVLWNCPINFVSWVFTCIGIESWVIEGLNEVKVTDSRKLVRIFNSQLTIDSTVFFSLPVAKISDLQNFLSGNREMGWNLNS